MPTVRAPRDALSLIVTEAKVIVDAFEQLPPIFQRCAYPHRTQQHINQCHHRRPFEIADARKCQPARLFRHDEHLLEVQRRLMCRLTAGTRQLCAALAARNQLGGPTGLQVVRIKRNPAGRTAPGQRDAMFRADTHPPTRSSRTIADKRVRLRPGKSGRSVCLAPSSAHCSRTGRRRS